MPDVTAAVSPREAVTNAADVVAANPYIAAAAAIAFVLLVVGLLRWRRRTLAQRFRRTLAASDEVGVLMHPNPDPDAMACALAVAAIAESVGTPATLAYPGQIRHQENRAFRTVLDLDVERVETATDLPEDLVLVDHNQVRGLDGEWPDPVAVVDHHPGDGTGTSFTDVRTDHGACATIVAEYFDDLDAGTGTGEVPAPEDHPGSSGEADDAGGDLVLTPRIATGLLYGILSDTTNLTRGCSAADFDAARYLYPAVDEDALDRIANPETDAEVLDVKARAITNRIVRSPYAVCDVETVENADAIPQAADELLQLEGISSVVVFGDVDGTIHLSGRSRDDRVHMGDALAAAVDAIPMADAGGHARMGGGQVPVDEDGEIEMVADVDRDDLVERIFAALAGDR